MAKHSDNKSSRNLIIGTAAATIIFFGVLGAIGYTAFSTTNEKVDKLADAVGTLVENQKTPDEFKSGVSDAIGQYLANEKQKKVDVLYQDFQAAGEAPIDGKWVYGEPNARFTMVEFSDYECPYCKRFHDTPKRIVDGSKGQVNWEFKHNPLPFHEPSASRMALAAECVGDQLGNRGFWVASEEIFARSGGNGAGVADLNALAEDVGADVGEFNECIESGKFDDKIAADLKRGTQLGVNGTPATFIVDNHTGNIQQINGAQPPEAIVGVLRSMMNAQVDSGSAEQGNDPS